MTVFGIGDEWKHMGTSDENQYIFFFSCVHQFCQFSGIFSKCSSFVDQNIHNCFFLSKLRVVLNTSFVNESNELVSKCVTL